MRVLLDTHVLLWLRREPKRLSKRVAKLLADEKHDCFVSSISAWEIGNKQRIGKLDFSSAFLDDFAGNIRDLGFEPLNLTPEHAIAGARLPGNHNDPFDRLLAGTASWERLKLVTADQAFDVLGVETVW